ncbi:MAG: HlyD family efflux transporter periplasmic adaptor subunit [Acetobacteraceae bacterium]|nr:HlyD family efflux transporter periplasmic adaptor subunit [Acetobacteraceae bacterium]
MLLLCAPALGAAAADFTVQVAPLADQKAVFATVESLDVVPARARIGGTVGLLAVKAGDSATPGQVLAVVADDKLLLRIATIDAQIAGLHSSLEQARADLARAETLYRQGSGPRVTMEQARTALDVANAAIQARVSERAVVDQQIAEGRVLAPVGGRVLTVPVTNGTVVLPGDTLASIAARNYVLRLRAPERHAAFIRLGDRVRLDTTGRGGPGVVAFGTITRLYPRIEDGRVVADADMAGLDAYFVGERVTVWIGAGPRPAIVIPAALIRTRFGLDYALVRRGAAVVETPIQRGRPTPSPEMTDGVEILSGLVAGDALVQP